MKKLSAKFRTCLIRINRKRHNKVKQIKQEGTRRRIFLFDLKKCLYYYLIVVTDKIYAPVAESVDALDLKSNRGSPSVPVQVWPGAITKRPAEKRVVLFFYNGTISLVFKRAECVSHFAGILTVYV